MNVTSNGRPYLGAAIGSAEFVESFVESKVSLAIQCGQPNNNSRDPTTRGHSAVTHGLSSKWTYICRTIPDISNLLKPLDNALRTKLIPALTRKSPPSDLEWALFALPARLGGLGITIPSQQANQDHLSSQLITSALQDGIKLQDDTYGHEVIAKQLESKVTVKNIKQGKKFNGCP